MTAFWTASLACLLACAMLAGCTAPEPPRTYADLDGVLHDPLDPSGVAANVMIFTTVDCPIANGYAPKIHAIVSEYADREVRFFLVHVDPEVTRAAAVVHAADFGYAIPILLDPEHRLVAATGVSITPEVAVLTADRGLAYRGRIDNWYGDLGKKRPRATRTNLRNALDAVLAGQLVVPARTDAVGCYIADLLPR